MKVCALSQRALIPDIKGAALAWLHFLRDPISECSLITLSYKLRDDSHAAAGQGRAEMLHGSVSAVKTATGVTWTQEGRRLIFSRNLHPWLLSGCRQPSRDL